MPATPSTSMVEPVGDAGVEGKRSVPGDGKPPVEVVASPPVKRVEPAKEAPVVEAPPAPVNPLLADDGESEAYAVQGSDLLREVDEGNFNPLLDDDGDEDAAAFTGRERGPKPTQVVPDRPDRDAVQEENRAKKAAHEEAVRLAREAARVGKPSTQDDSIDFKRRPVAEVSAGAVAKETKAHRQAQAAKKAAEEGSEGHIETPRGSERWAVKAVDGAPSGRLGSEELTLFANLSLANSDQDAKDELRAIFARVDEKGEDEEAKAKRKELAKRALLGDEAIERGTRRQFTEKDRDVLRFLAKFKYANAKHVSRILQVNEKTMEKRLHALRKRGLLVQKALYGAKPLWYLTEAGMICSGMDLPRTKESGITYGMLPHGFVVNHVAGNLWAGGINVLNLEAYPVRNRVREKGEMALGEELVSELEIQSSFSQIRIGSSKESYRPLIADSRDRLFKEWTKAGGPTFGVSPEQLPGNEFMWTLIPPFNLNLAYHVPDLVVKRPRNADGTADSIAVEIELANKPYALYERALSAYKYDSLIYGQVIWVVKSRGAARKLEQAADKLGLLDEGRVDIVPIYTEEGIFTGKAEWTI